MSSGMVNESSTITSIIDITKEIDTSSSNVEKVLQLINSLNQFSVNMNILKVTKIGKKMSKLSQSKVPALSKAANDLVNRWKKEIKSNKQGKDTTTEVSSHAGKESSKPAPKPAEVSKPPQKTQEEEKAPARQEAREADVAYEQAKHDDNNDDDYDEFVSTHYTSDGVRQNIRKGTCNPPFPL